MVTFWVASLILFVGRSNGQSAELPNLKDNLLNSITVSGFSSGGAMATQFHVAHSSIIKGMAGVSSSFYRCVQGQGGNILYGLACTHGLTPVSSAVRDARAYAKEGKIDPLSNLQGSRVFIWSGIKDIIVFNAVARKGATFYRNFVPRSNIRFVTHYNASHEFPTDDYGPPCPLLSVDFIGNCNYSGSYNVLSYLLGSSIQRPSDGLQINELKYFNQSEFTAGKQAKDIGMDDAGFYYIPSKCTGSNQCPLHIFFHGCTLGLQILQPGFFRSISYLKIAEENGIILLFPMAAPRSDGGNLAGCWDVSGENGDNYATKDAVQISAVRRMISRLYGEN